MALTVGTQLGSYEIAAQLGKGGMGEVYRARDTKLKREVAIKILPDEFSRDADRVSRFQREAEVLASLNHPNIAAIHDLAEANGSRYLVLELVEGDTLADRIVQGAIPAEEAVTIAKQICEALEAAHEKGIIHRDLKPANIKLTPQGQVKVLDFGLAKLCEPDVLSMSTSNSPTMMSMAATNAGMILGTAAYMSPEQARGRPLDRRTDIFSFGCVLYEMLTGRRAFEGEDATEILSRVLQHEPDWTRLRADVPLGLRRLLRRCLEKDVRRRRSDAADVRIDLDEALAEPPAVATPPAGGSWLAWSVAAVIALVAVALTAVAIALVRGRTAEPPPEMRLEITTPPTLAPLDIALSPDGHQIVFAASAGGPERLWLRGLDQTEAKPIQGTDGATYPFWSADSRSIGYFSSGRLYRVDLIGGPPQALVSTPSYGTGGTWNKDGVILFASSPTSALFRVAASGGEPVAVTQLDTPRQSSHRFPHFLPDGRHFLYWVQGTPEVSGVYLASLDGGEVKRLVAADSSGVFLPPNRIVFQRQTVLIAQQIDLERGTVIGDPIQVADSAGTAAIGQGGFSVSTEGQVAYRTGGGRLLQLVWYDRSGNRLAGVGEPDAAVQFFPELSSDGQRVVIVRAPPLQADQDIWIRDLAGGGLTRFTFDPAVDGAPVWSPDGARIAFASRRKRDFDLYIGPSSRAGAETPLLESPNAKVPQDWSKDGRFLLYFEIDPRTGHDLWALPMTGADADRKPFPVVKTSFEEQNGQFSPDGRLLAYETNESGRFEIVVQAFPEARGKWQVSTGGGVQPRWRADGRELFFLGPDGNLMATSVTTSGGTLVTGTPVSLFPARVTPVGGGANKQQYVVSRDGTFLINQSVERSAAPIMLILNWKPPAR